MVVFVLVAAVAAHAPWTGSIPLAVLALVGLRLVAKPWALAWALGSHTHWRQTLWTACAMAPFCSGTRNDECHSQTISGGETIAGIALPTILLMELLGAMAATWALRRAGEARDTSGSAP